MRIRISGSNLEFSWGLFRGVELVKGDLYDEYDGMVDVADVGLDPSLVTENGLAG